MTQSKEVKSTDYVVVKDELTKCITLGEYVKLKGLTDNNWLLIYDYHSNKLITGVRADCLMRDEKDYYVVIVKNYIFPQYTVYSERPYYIEVYISKTSIDYLIPVVYTETELKVSEPPVEDDEPSEENKQAVELTPLELSVFEKAYEIYCDLEDETIDHEVDCYVYDIFNEIMSKSKTLKTYWLWLDERKKQGP